MSEVKGAPGKANFVGFVFVGFYVLLQIVLNTMNQLVSSVHINLEAMELTFVARNPSITELLLVIGFALLYPFLFALCVEMFQRFEEVRRYSERRDPAG